MEPKYFAKINLDGIVETVVVAESDLWCRNNLGGEWIETFMSDPGKNYAGVGHKYDKKRKNFVAPKPFKSWVLNDKCVWEPPVPYPDISKTNKRYSWDEDKKDWAESVRFELLKELTEETTEKDKGKTSEEEK